MSTVIGQFAHHVSPLGPFGDPLRREEEEAAWIASLTLDAARELIAWAVRPTQLPDWGPLDEDRLNGMRNMAAYFTACAGEHLGDPIRHALEGLLADPETRECALYGLETLGDPAAIPAIAAHAGDPDTGVAAGVANALGEIGGDEASAILRKMRDSWKDRDSRVRKEIDAYLEPRPD